MPATDGAKPESIQRVKRIRPRRCPIVDQSRCPKITHCQTQSGVSASSITDCRIEGTEPDMDWSRELYSATRDDRLRQLLVATFARTRDSATGTSRRCHSYRVAAGYPVSAKSPSSHSWSVIWRRRAWARSDGPSPSREERASRPPMSMGATKMCILLSRS